MKSKGLMFLHHKNHEPVEKGKVGFLIKNNDGKKQKAMAMFMSNGFGITADMKEKGVYAITTKAVFGKVKLMDNFIHEIK